MTELTNATESWDLDFADSINPIPIDYFAREENELFIKLESEPQIEIQAASIPRLTIEDEK